MAVKAMASITSATAAANQTSAYANLAAQNLLKNDGADISTMDSVRKLFSAPKQFGDVALTTVAATSPICRPRMRWR